METKKSEKANLEKTKPAGILLGFIVSLAVVFVGFEWGTRDVQDLKGYGIPDIFIDDGFEIPTTPPPPPPPPPQPQPALPDVLTIVDNNIDIPDAPDFTSEDNPTEALPPVPPDLGDLIEEEVPTYDFFINVEEMPEFPGGDIELLKFIQKTVRYPTSAAEIGAKGRVVCTFIINQDGSVVEAEVLRGVDPALDKEALRVINQMPKWKPGKQRGKAVRVKFTMPINFTLQ